MSFPRRTSPSMHPLACGGFYFYILVFLQLRVLPTKDISINARQLASRWPCDLVTVSNGHLVPTPTHSLAYRDFLSHPCVFTTTRPSPKDNFTSMRSIGLSMAMKSSDCPERPLHAYSRAPSNL